MVQKCMKLKTYLEKYRVDRREFANECEVDPISLYRWETGRRTPRGKHIIKIMEATKNRVTANDFIDYERP